MAVLSNPYVLDKLFFKYKADDAEHCWYCRCGSTTTYLLKLSLGLEVWHVYGTATYPSTCGCYV
jgi:hypothetical protein